MNLNDSLDDDICVKNNDIFNYKGYFVENEGEDNEPKFFEFGAHFSYKELFKSLQELRNKQIKAQKLNQIESNKHINNKKISNRERNNTKNNNNKRKDINLNIIMKIFKSKGKSRNIWAVETKNDNINEMTFVPKINSKNNFYIKKEDKNNKSTFNNIIKYNQTNYMRISKDIKNKIYSNSNSNQKLNISNRSKNNKLNKIKINKHPDKFILSRNKNVINLIKSNKTSIKINKIKNEDKCKKRIFVGIPNSSKKTIFMSSLNNIGKTLESSKKKLKNIKGIFNYYYKNKEIKKINLGNSDICSKTSNSFSNNSKINKPKNKLKLNDIKKLIKNSSIFDKKISLKKKNGLNIKRKESKKNININIEINNNNNIIYNTINKRIKKINNSNSNTKNREKSLLTINFQKLRISASFTKNNISINSLKNGYNSHNNHHSYYQKHKNYNKVINCKNNKAKFINIKFPKVKFINITNS